MAFATENLIDSCKRVSTNKARCKDTNLFSNCMGFNVLFCSYCAFLTYNTILVTYIKLQIH
nr:MAG TPA: hypothetical protein [Caudoviricetes sp.]